MNAGVVTPDARATEAAALVLKLGGTAADAAITASAVLGVVQPHTCGLGGDVVAVVNSMSGSSVLLGIGNSGSNAHGETLRNQGFRDIPRTHPAAVTIPGALDGWLKLHARHGRLPFEQLLGRAIELAESGFLVNAELESELNKTPWNPETGPPRGVKSASNARVNKSASWKRPHLARLLQRVASEGRSALYSGEVANDILGATDGLVTRDDLAADQASLAMPLTISGRDLTLLIPGQPTQGAVLGQTFSLMEELDGWRASSLGEAIHLLIESYRVVVEDAVSLSLASDTDSTTTTAARVNRHQASYRRPLVGILGGTAFLAAADSEGCLVAMSQSNYDRLGSGRVARSAGLPLNNRGTGFSLESGHVNELRPNARPFHTLIPTIVRHSDGAVSAMGTRGGLLQPQILLQLLLWSLRSGTHPAAQLSQPRLNVRPEVATSLVFAESSLPRGIAEELTLRGHRVVLRSGLEPSWGPAFVLTVGADGRVDAGVDPRSEGKAWTSDDELG